MAEQRLNLLDLPTEILVHILNPFPTTDLLPLTPLCRSVHTLILRILHYRLLLAAGDPTYRLILEAYHPSRRYTRPYLFCTYLGTDGLSSSHEGVGVFYDQKSQDGDTGTLGRLGGLYSSFRPEYPDLEGTIPVRRIAGAAPVLAQTQAVDGGDGSVAAAGPAGGTANPGVPTTTPIYRNAGDGGARKIMYTINLDEGELFGQFCVYAQLVSGWRRRGIFDATVNVVQPGQGTIRIWRKWLVGNCKAAYEKERARQEGTGVTSGEEYPAGEALTRSSTMKYPNVKNDPDIMWTDHKKNVGLRVEVRHRDVTAYRRTSEQLEEDALSCDLIIQELLVRTTHLMLAVEEAAAAMQSSNGSGKALVFANFATRIGADSN